MPPAQPSAHPGAWLREGRRGALAALPGWTMLIRPPSAMVLAILAACTPVESERPPLPAAPGALAIRTDCDSAAEAEKPWSCQAWVLHADGSRSTELSLAAAPEGLTLDDGRLWWTPSANQAGTQSLVLVSGRIQRARTLTVAAYLDLATATAPADGSIVLDPAPTRVAIDSVRVEMPARALPPGTEVRLQEFIGAPELMAGTPALRLSVRAPIEVGAVTTITVGVSEATVTATASRAHKVQPLPAALHLLRPHALVPTQAGCLPQGVEPTPPRAPHAIAARPGCRGRRRGRGRRGCRGFPPRRRGGRP